ncbi:MAG: TrkH family potassium uptake protein [Oscillospiraceae bacterium]
MPFSKRERTTPAQIIILGFLLLILAGTALLMLPFATRDGAGAPLLDALFTATSATCVTGLVVHDTMQYWSGFGQAVILLLIQVGGMGVVTMAVAVFMFAGRKIGLKQRWVMQESISAPQVGGIVRMTGFILKASFAIEGIGAVLLALRFCRRFDFWKGLWFAVFHSVSAFCNAGFDLMGETAPGSSLTGFAGDVPVNLTITALIIVGGLGFLTWQDVAQHGRHLRRYRLQSKLILITTAALLILGFAFFALYEFRLPQWQGLSAGERTLRAWFQSVTLRTAGFNTVELTSLSGPTVLLMLALMLVGGSPGSTAGGFKTTTLAVLLLNMRAVFRRRDNAHCFGRRLSDGTVRNAGAILMLYLLLFLSGGMVICCVEGLPLLTAMFEAGSAIGTVGLSMGVTSELSAVSQLILIFLMYFGRVGGLTMIYAVAGNAADGPQYPQEQVTVG